MMKRQMFVREKSKKSAEKQIRSDRIMAASKYKQGDERPRSAAVIID